MFLTRLISLIAVSFVAGPACIDENPDEFPPTVRLELGVEREITGQITAQSGGVILPKGVRIYATNARHFAEYLNSHPNKNKGALCSATGSYSIPVVDSDHVLFVARGFAPLWVKAPKGNSLDVELSQGRSVTGTILSADGEPVSGARIKLVNWLIPRPKGRFRRWGSHDGSDRNDYAAFPDFGASLGVSSDSSGRFTMHNIPANFRVALRVSAPNFKPQIVFVRAVTDGGFDQRAIDFPKQILLKDDFEFRMEDSSVLRITGVEDESGEPARIRSISIDPRSDISNPQVIRNRVEIDDVTGAVNLHQFPKEFVVWVEPVDNDRLLGCRLAFPPNADAELIEREVRFKAGKIVRGMVKDEATNELIANVPLVWRTDDMKQFDASGNFAPLAFSTDEAGAFEVAIPQGDGVLGIAGDVPGYMSDFGWNRQEEYKSFAPEILERFTRTISAGDRAETPFEFLLQPSHQLNITTVTSEGTPVADCTVFSKVAQPNVFQRSWGTKNVSVATDIKGKAKLSHWYFDSWQLACARAIADGVPRESGGIRRPDSRYPTRVIAFSEGGILQGSAIIPIPDTDAGSNEIEVSIEMQTTGSIAGSIVGVDGEPVKKVWIRATAGSMFSGGLGWWTSTRDDGQFLLKNIPVGIPLEWQIDTSRVKVTQPNARIELDISQLRSGETLEVPPIVVVDYSHLAEPLADIDLESLEDEEALVALTKYAHQNLAKLPKREMSLSGTYSSQDADALFVQKLAKKLEGLVIELGDRDPGGDYELKVLSAASWWFHDPRNMGGVITSYGQSLNYAIHARLLENHIENELAQDALIRNTTEVSRMTLGRDGGGKWRDLREKSPFKKTKSAASVKLLFHDWPSAMGHCSSKYSDDQFETQFSKLESCASDIIDGLPELDEQSRSTLEFRLKSFEPQLKIQLENVKEDGTRKRLEKIAKLFAPLLQKL